MPRLFVALEMPEEAVAGLVRLCSGLPGASWTDPADLHLTLRFIGEVDHDTFVEIGQGLHEIMLRPFELTLKGLGLFPPRGEPRHLWAGVEDGAVVEPLRRRVDRVVDAAGVPRERRRFVPHVTLARFREPPPADRLGSWLTRRALFRLPSFPVSGFNLYSSYPGGQDAYVVEAGYDFVTGVMERA